MDALKIRGLRILLFPVIAPLLLLGWVLIVVGIGVAAAAAGTSIYLDKTIKENAGSWYDSIMKRTISK